MLDYKIYTFLSLCKNMSFTKTADELNITQPAVSQHIKYLEEMYNTKLIEFNGKKMYVTKAGKMLFNAATTMFNDSIHLKENISLIKKERKQLSFGVTLTIGEYVIPSIVESIINKYTDTNINIKVANTKELFEDISNGKIDFALIEGYFDKSEYDYITYSVEDYIAVSGEKIVVNSIEDLLEQKIVVREVGSGTREICEKILQVYNLKIDDFKGKVEINNIMAIKKMVEKNIGISFMYKRVVNDELKSEKLYEIKIRNLAVKHNFTFVWRKNSIYSDFYKEIFELIKIK